MPSVVALVLLLLVVPAAAETSQEKDVLGKVFQLMDELTAKIEKEGEVEAKA